MKPWGLNPCKGSPPVSPHFLFFLWQTHMKPERRLTILLVSVKYRISEVYAVWPLWWSVWAKQPAGFPLKGPTPRSHSARIMKGFCSVSGTAMYGLYLLGKTRFKYQQKDTHGIQVHLFLYRTAFLYSASHQNNFPHLFNYTKRLSCSKQNG